jgi:RimJ/RimL family protein N-acetyltransferase
MVTLVPLTVFHVIEVYPKLRGDVANCTFEEVKAHAMTASSYGEAYGFVADDGTTIGIGGVMNGGNGTGTLWIMGTEDIPKHARAFTRALLKIRDPLMRRNNLHRLQSEVMADKKNWIAWAESCGMKKEGCMRQFTKDKQDCALVAYILEEDK